MLSVVLLCLSVHYCKQNTSYYFDGLVKNKQTLGYNVESPRYLSSETEVKKAEHFEHRKPAVKMTLHSISCWQLGWKYIHVVSLCMQ